MKNKKLILIGPYSSIGGVSEHIKRLKYLLEDKYEVKIIDESKLAEANKYVFNIRNGKILGYLSLISRADVIHIHTGVWWLRLIHILISKFFLKKVVVTVHSLTNINNISLKFSRYIFKLNNYTIFVSEAIREAFNQEKNSKNSVIPAFLPPFNNDGILPKDLSDLINNSGQRIIVANAYRIVIKNNKDLYGVDMAINVAMLFKSKQINCKIIFIIASLLDGEDLFYKYSKYISENKLNEYIVLYPKPINFPALIRVCDLILRPTISDGDALTVREALYFNKPVIASDVVKRPEGTILYKNNDYTDLFEKIVSTLSEKNIERKHNLKTDYKKIYYKIYNS